MKLSSTFFFYTFKTFCCLLVVVLNTSCGSKKFQRQIETPEIKINLIGNKPTSMDPFSVGLIVTNNANGKTVSLDLEVYASELNEKNPLFIKKENHKYALLFKQTDLTTRELILSTSDEEVIVEEVL